MGKWITNFFLYALAILLMFYTSSRTLDLLAWILPANQQIVSYLALAAFDGGMVFWAFYFVHGAKGVSQRSISLIMAVFSIVAVSVATIADTTLNAAQKGEIAALSQSQAQAIVIFVGVAIVLDVAAFLFCKMLSVENLRRMEEQSAEDQIFSEGLKAIKTLAPTIAAEAAPYLASAWANRTWQSILPGVHHETHYLPQQASSPAPVAAPVSPAPARTVSSEPERRGLNAGIGKVKGFFSKDRSQTIETRALAQEGTIDSNPTRASEMTSNQIYKRERNTVQASTRTLSPVAQRRQANRAQRLARPTGQLVDVHGNPISSASVKPKSIDVPAERETEKVAVPSPLAEGGQKADQGADSQMQSMRASGKRGRKQGSVRGATPAK